MSSISYMRASASVDIIVSDECAVILSSLNLINSEFMNCKCMLRVSLAIIYLLCTCIMLWFVRLKVCFFVSLQTSSFLPL